MIRKLALLFVVLFVISCSSRRVVIQTSKSGKYNPQPTVVIKKANENNIIFIGFRNNCCLDTKPLLFY